MNVQKDKKLLDNSYELIKYLKINSPTSLKPLKKGNETRIIRKTLKNFIFKGNFHGIFFKHVKFVNCEFEGIWGFFCIFENCEFQHCEFRNSRFSHLELNWNGIRFDHCYFRNVEIDEGSLFNISFNKCQLNTVNLTGHFPVENIRFYDCFIEESNFSNITYYDEDEIVERDDEFIDLLYLDCNITTSNFNGLDLRNSRYIDCNFYKSGFTDCVLNNESFLNNKEIKIENYATFDFQTILKSENLNFFILSTYFNIKNNINLKEIISTMTTSIKFSTVFISYSFKDSDIARKINDHLNNKGIRTFIWEKDAPGGKPLEEIMTSGIGTHDKLLFISSENSIKSRACQFELTTARKKQEGTWENIFFPITIDRYLFDVEKNQIRPLENADEFWKNIEEIKSINALDFSQLTNKSYSKFDFEKMMNKLVEGLEILE